MSPKSLFAVLVFMSMGSSAIADIYEHLPREPGEYQFLLLAKPGFGWELEDGSRQTFLITNKYYFACQRDAWAWVDSKFGVQQVSLWSFNGIREPATYLPSEYKQLPEAQAARVILLPKLDPPPLIKRPEGADSDSVEIHLINCTDETLTFTLLVKTKTALRICSDVVQLAPRQTGVWKLRTGMILCAKAGDRTLYGLGFIAHSQDGDAQYVWGQRGMPGKSITDSASGLQVHLKAILAEAERFPASSRR